MKNPIFPVAAAVLVAAVTSCTHKTTFQVQEPSTGITMYARDRTVENGDLPSDRQVTAVTRKMTRGLTPEQLGREYFPHQGPGGKATVTITPHTGSAPAKPGWSRTCYVAQVTVSAKASRSEFQEALNQINRDFYKRAIETEMIVKLEELPVVVDGKPTPPTYSIRQSVDIPVKR